jgi:hypothetical protein
MDYLANPFNYSVNSYSNEGLCGILNMISLILFHTIIIRIIAKLEDIHLEEDIIKYNKNIEEVPDNVFANVFINKYIDKNIKQDLISLLDINSLERNYILYYIFKKRGFFYSHINTYLYYKQVVNDWRNIYFTDDDMSLIMSLDESLENDYQIVIDNIIYHCSVAHIRFLSWLYYSGIYSYLMNNQEIMKTVLNDMNTKKILKGNLFLKYHLYLIAMEDKDNNNNNNNNNNDNDEKLTEEYNISTNLKNNVEEMENIDNKIDDTNENADDNEDDIDYSSDNENADDNVNENADDIDYSSDNEDELNKRPITEDLNNQNETSFIIKLFTSIGNIVIGTLQRHWNLIKEESVELLHPVFG